MYRSIQTPANANAKYSIHTLDTPGFQDPESVGVTTGTSFDNLCHNYSQERLQMLFHDSTFTAEQDRYIQVSILLSLYMYNYSVWLKWIVSLLSEYPDLNTSWIYIMTQSNVKVI